MENVKKADVLRQEQAAQLKHTTNEYQAQKAGYGQAEQLDKLCENLTMEKLHCMDYPLSSL